MPIRTDVTFSDLIAAYDDELADLEAGYEETVAFIRDEWGDDAIDRPIPTDTAGLTDDDLEHLAAMRATASAYEESGKQIQRRNHALETLSQECDGDTFGLRMLTGAELMDIERDLKLKAQAEDVEQSVVEHYRKALVVDAATVDAPEGVDADGEPLIPRDDDGSPLPSEAGNPLTLALYEAVENLNQAGAVDFRAPGFGDRDLTPAVESSGRPTPAAPSSKPTGASSDPTGDTPEPGR